MSSGRVEDLVTQVPDEEGNDSAAVHGPVSLQTSSPSLRQSRFAKLCSCLLGHKPKPSQAGSASKLASVVPGQGKEGGGAVAVASASEEAESAVATAVQAPAQPRRKHPAPSREAIWGPKQNEPPQLGPQVGHNRGRKTLVLDLDETLVHSSFRATTSADIIILVELEGEHHRVYVRKRPGVDEFLVRVAQMYEVVVYTASMAKYANPLMDELDKFNTVASRLFREACTRQPGGYVKDLSKLGRDLKHVIIIDNSPICYAFQPNNAIPIRMWKDDVSDRELHDLIPILYSLADVEDIPLVLKQIVWAPDEEDKDT